MCEVAGMITAMTAIAGGIGSYAQSVQQNQQAQANQAYQIAVARSNAEAALINSQYALDAGEREANKLDDQKRLALGIVKKKFGASNVEINSGSPYASLVSKSTEFETKKSDVMQDAEKQAWNYQVNANNSLNQANFLASQNISGVGPYNSLMSIVGTGLDVMAKAISYA